MDRYGNVVRAPKPVLSRTQSKTSQTSRSSRASRSQRLNLQRTYSARAFDDHSAYAYNSDDDQEEAADVAAVNADFTADTTPAKHASETTDDPEKQIFHEKSTTSSADQQEEYEEGYEHSRDALSDADVEANPNLKESQTNRSVRSIRDGNVVGWAGPDDPENPKNWPMRRKWAATFVVSCFTFISPVSSSMIAPALPAMSRDLGIHTEIEAIVSLSIFVLAYAIGPLFLGPLSEVYGRVPVLQISNLFYLAWNIGCSFAQTPGQMIAFRFLAGLGGSAPLSIGGGVLSDCWRAEERGKAISVYTVAPLIGPAVGPLAGGFIAETVSWRWVFWSTSIADAVIQLIGLLWLQETYSPVLLHRRAQKLKKELDRSDLRSEHATDDWKVGKMLRTALSRPFKFLFTQPIIQVIAVYMAYMYGLMYLVFATFPSLWEDVYGESVGIGGLNYIALGLGFTLGTQICAPINDRIYRKLKKRNNGVGLPEFRIPLMFLGSALLPIGLFMYAWSAEAKTFWLVPDIGSVIWAAGAIVNFQCMQTYIIDSYTRYAASGIAAAVVLRSIAGFGFPLFAPAMYAALGYGWGTSIMGFLAIAIGIPAPFVFWYYGAKLRGNSEFAAD